MKPRFLLPVIATALLLTNLGVSQVAIAQLSQEDLIESIDEIPFGDIKIIEREYDPAVQERNLRKEFRGIDLTPQEFEQIRQARRKFHQELKTVVKKDFGSIIQLVFLPKAEAESRSGEVFSNPLTNYSNAMSKILTPEEIKIWQQNMEESAHKRRNQDS